MSWLCSYCNQAKALINLPLLSNAVERAVQVNLLRIRSCEGCCWMMLPATCRLELGALEQGSSTTTFSRGYVAGQEKPVRSALLMQPTPQLCAEWCFYFHCFFSQWRFSADTRTPAFTSNLVLAQMTSSWWAARVTATRTSGRWDAWEKPKGAGLPRLAAQKCSALSFHLLFMFM